VERGNFHHTKKNNEMW